MPIANIPQPDFLRISDTLRLRRYDGIFDFALEWYQDLELCKQVDNRDTAYDINLLKGMYKYLNNHGDLFYIKYKNRENSANFISSGKNKATFS